MQVQDKAAIITGGGTGVGRATALSLARAGCHVLVNYSRSEAEARATAAEAEAMGVKAMAFCADVADDAGCRAMVDAAVNAFGRLDVLINNAGTTRFIPFAELDRLTDEVWQRLFAVNVQGAFQCTRAAAGPMREAGEGEVVNVSSIAGVTATGSSIAYAASKAALNNMTVALARTLAPDIRVNAVAPGFITGRWLRNGIGQRYDAVKAAFQEQMPLRKVCQPQDVADAIMSLVTGSDLVTGQVLLCDGGMSIMDQVRI